MKKPCPHCKDKQEELDRLRANQSQQIQAHVTDERQKHLFRINELQKWTGVLIAVLEKVTK